MKKKRNTILLSIANHRRKLLFYGKTEKRIPNLGNKRKYKLHYQDLKLYLELGLQLKKVLELEFKSKNILKTVYRTKYRIVKRSRKQGNKV